ncbi:MAG: hypothetical protein DWQ07_16480 [Chloroflexi bacterium]|nr:MAG: hypothetical protein DWQ07_16480 [Chloroflexota bacterium]MBL1195350.1 hypothetical protein [Chloroflexota bacterium]NOH12634.1 hypothetical protein [Chloroflexota bacterium]
MPETVVYLPGESFEPRGPLARYLPRLSSGVVGTWLENKVTRGQWVIDPFGASPELAVQAARAGYKVLVAANNPIARFLLEQAATPPSVDIMRSALAELGAAKRGDERLEPHIKDLYSTSCDHCSQMVHADAFLWEKDADAPYARIYNCPHCEHKGEFPATEEDIAKAKSYARGGLHQARALERVAPSDDPNRRHVEEALEAYLPRAVYALFTLINRLDGLLLPSEQRNALRALLLTACDRANVLWAHPSGRLRPKQLSAPPRFREHNIWLALEEAMHIWTSDAGAVPMTYWPDAPPDVGGISLYEGRLRDLAPALKDIDIAAVLTAYPRPNQAFWTLSALWAGWLWGREAVGPFAAVLKRRRYDWAWHTTALEATLSHLAPQLKENTPLLGLVSESEAGFDMAAMVSTSLAGFELDGVALRPEDGQTQLHWQRAEAQAEKSEAKHEDIIQQAGQEYLGQLGQASGYLPLQAAALQAMLAQGALPEVEEDEPGEVFSETRSALEFGLTFRSGFLRYSGSEHSLDVGSWWLRDAPEDVEEPLGDRVEKTLVQQLVAEPGSSFLRLDAAICSAFPGLQTPPQELVDAILQSYAREDESDTWPLREDDQPKARRADLDEINTLLKALGERLGYDVVEGEPMVWKSGKEIVFNFYVIASAVLGEIVYEASTVPEKSLIVFPGGRSGLVLHKLEHDARLKTEIDKGWRFLKFRHLRRMGENQSLTQDSFKEQLALDPLSEDETQIPLL